MTSDELHQWMLSTFGPTAGENAWQQFQQLPEQIRSQMLAAGADELPTPEQMRGLMQAFADAGFGAPGSPASSAAGAGDGSGADSADRQAEGAKLTIDPKTGNPIGFQVPGASAGGDGTPADSAGSARPTGINVDLARQIALISLPSDSQTVVTGAQDRGVRSAFSSASLWLDSATGFDPGKKEPTAITRADWVTSTIDRWAGLVSPVAKATAQALGSVFASRMAGDADAVTTKIFAGPIQISLPDNLKDPRRLMEAIGSASFSMQLGQSAARLATEVLGGFDQGLRLSDSPAGSIVVQNAEGFAQGLSVPQEEVLSFLALRELATARLYENVPWLSTQIQTLVEKYAQYITIDLDAIEEQLRDAGEMSPEGLSGAVNISNVAMDESEEQRQAKASLGRMLALIEGWVDAVTWRAGQASLPHIARLREMMRRRRASGSPAEQTFRQLMGLDLRPVDARQACTAWETIMDTQGSEAADALWRHPDTLPVFGKKSANTEHDWDAGLDALLREESGEDDGTQGTDDAGSTEDSSDASDDTGTQAQGEDQDRKSDDDPHDDDPHDDGRHDDGDDTDGDGDGTDHPDDRRRS